MKQYKINEIFYSLQGEGYHTGTAAIFIRFSGCNLKCPFCDTIHQDGQMYSAEEIVAQIEEYPSNFVVLTGGEPTLQADEQLVALLHEWGYFVAMETNGTKFPPSNVDWVTLSPKDLFCHNAQPVLSRTDEIKVVYNGKVFNEYPEIRAKYRYIQPCDTGDEEKNKEITNQVVEFIKNNPQWKLSLQTQKILKVQ